MSKAEAKKRIAKLKKVINHHNYFYHVLDKPKISDAAFDSLKNELHKLEQENPELITQDSPSQRVSGQAMDKFDKVRHKKRMLSLEDVFCAEELQSWEDRFKKRFQVSGFRFHDLDYFAELKIDGFAIALVYQNGVLIQGATRGNGQIGEDVTQNLKTIKSIPLRLEIQQEFPNKRIQKKAKAFLEKGRIEIRGEVYMTKKAFAKVNQQREKEELPLYANPRNTAAGTIRQLDPKIAGSRELKFLAYDLITDLGQKTHQQKHQIIRALGFRTSQEEYCADLKQAVKFWNKIEKNREQLPHQIDGIVVSVNNNRVFTKLGIVGKAPRGTIAFKFPAKEATTMIEDIVVQIGRTGALTPVAHLKPVRLTGILITRATLHNADEIKRLDVRIGDTVVIQRAGDVIPDVVKVIKKLRSGKEKKFIMPEKCPMCGGKIIRPKGEVVHRCINKQCSSIQKQRIIHFASKKGFEIEGLGPQIISQLMDQGLIANSADIFSLTQGDLIPLERFAEKSADNLIRAISQSRKISLARFIYALGIRYAGEETAIVLARHFINLANLQKADREELAQIQDVGQVVAKSVYQWFNNRRNQQLIDKLIESGIEIKKQKAIKKKLTGLNFVLTGELNRFTRDQAKAVIRELGGDVLSSVSQNTDFVVVGREPGSKYDKARKLGVKIIEEREFLEMLDN